MSWLEHEEQRYPLHRVDPIANANRTRDPIATRGAKRGIDVAFDPPSALLSAMLGQKMGAR